MGSIAATTLARRGSTSDSTTRGRSAAFWSILPIRAPFMWGHSGMRMGRTTSVESTSRPTAENTGSGCWIRVRALASPTLQWRRAGREFFLRRRGMRIGRHGARMRRSKERAMRFTGLRTAVRTGRRFQAMVCRMQRGDGRGLRSVRTGGASTRPSTARGRPGFTGPTMGATAGRWPAPTRASSAGRGISTPSRSILRTPMSSTSPTSRCTARTMAGRRSRLCAALRAETTTTRCGSIRRTRITLCWAWIRERAFRSIAGRRGRPGTTRRPRSCIT